MEEGLSLDNILGADEIDNLFVSDVDTGDSSPEEKEEKSQSQEETADKEKKDDIAEIDTENLFDGQSESVGSGKDDNEEREDTASIKDVGASPENFYSSIAKALKEEGIFPDLDDETYSRIREPEDFRELVEKQIQAGLDERQRRIDEALNAGVEVTDIQRYENTLRYIDSITDDKLTDEGENGENLRKNLIFQDYVNRGYSKERAQREVKKSLDAGSDVEDAREALRSNREFFKDGYDKLVEEARKVSEREASERREQAARLKSSILEDKNVFGDLNVDKPTRQRIYDNIVKPVYKDPDTGDLYTAIQKYEMDNRIDFLKNVSLIFTLTDGFKDLDGLVKGKVRREVKKGLRELENTLNNTVRTSDGSLRFASGVKEDPESIISKGWSLDV